MNRNDLIKYWDKEIKIKCNDGNELIGIFEEIDDKVDNESGKDELILEFDSGALVSIPIDEINSLEEIKKTA